MKFLNRHVLYHAGVVLLTTLLIYYAAAKLPEGGLLSIATILYVLAIAASAFLNNRADDYQGFFGFNYHLVTYAVCVGLPLLLRSLGYLPDVAFVGGMALIWGIGLVVHLLIFFVFFRKRKIGNYDRQEIFR